MSSVPAIDWQTDIQVVPDFFGSEKQVTFRGSDLVFNVVEVVRREEQKGVTT